jgi:hypothetical protein
MQYECLVALTGFEAYFNNNCKIVATNSTELKIVLSSILMPGQVGVVEHASSFNLGFDFEVTVVILSRMENDLWISLTDQTCFFRPELF